MESGGIPDFCITASSSRQFIKDLQPQFGRLNNPDIAWWSDLQQPGDWLKIDLVRKMIVTKIATRGRPDYGSSWVTSYKISFSQDDRRQPSWISRPQMGSLQGARDGKCKSDFTFRIPSITKICCDTETRELAHLCFIGAVVS